MKPGQQKLRLGIVGCGAIGSRIAMSLKKELNAGYRLAALYDLDNVKAAVLARNSGVKGVLASSLDDVIAASDVIVECVNSTAAVAIVIQALKAGKKVLVMSVGRIFDQPGILRLARQGELLFPSGAIAGLDAFKAAALAGLRRVTLTSRKPPEGFQGNAFLARSGLDLGTIKTDTVLYEGGVKGALKRFPQNINVAATLSLAVVSARVKVRIIAVPGLTCNTHEIVVEGKAGIIRTVTENYPCPDNRKTSYLAVLSGIQTLKQIADPVRVGT